MPFMPMYGSDDKSLKCSITPAAERSGGGWYCATCDTQFGERSAPPCGVEALPNEKYDKPGLLTRVNVFRDFR